MRRAKTRVDIVRYRRESQAIGNFIVGAQDRLNGIAIRTRIVTQVEISVARVVGLVSDITEERTCGRSCRVDRSEQECLRLLLLALIVRSIDVQRDRQAICRSPVQEQPACEFVLIAVFLVVEKIPALPATKLCGLCSHTRTKRVAQRSADICLGVCFTPMVYIDPETRLEGISRFRRDYVDRSTGRVLSKQRSLRPLEHFNTLDIEEQRLTHDRIGNRGFVNVGTDGWRRRCLERVEVDAAKRKDRRTEDRSGCGKTGNDSSQVGCIDHTGSLKGFCGSRNDRNRHVTQSFFALLSGHDDFETSALFSSWLLVGHILTKRSDRKSYQAPCQNGPSHRTTKILPHTSSHRCPAIGDLFDTMDRM